MLSFTKALPSFLPSFFPSSSYLRSSASSHPTIRMKQRARAVSRKGGLSIFEMCLVATRDLSPEMRPIWPSSLLYALKTWRHCCHRGISCTLLSKLSRMGLVCHMLNGRDLVPWKQELRSEIPANEWIQLLRTNLYRDRLKSMQILLSMTQAGPGRTGKQEQEQTSRNHVQAF